MLRYLVRRVVYSVPVLVVASFLIYWGIRSTPGYDPLARYRRTRDAARLVPIKRHELGLDRSIVAQWWSWLTHAVRGDFGNSARTNDDVRGMLQHALWPTMQLLFWGTIFALALAIAVGVYSAVKQYSVGDYTFTALSYVGIAMPPFVVGILSIAFFSTYLSAKLGLDTPIFYSVGLHSEGVAGVNLDYFRHLALPVLTLTVQSIAVWSRYQRSSMLEVLDADYVRTARAKGVPRRRVIYRHALRNALVPLVTVTALDTAFLVGGVIITEKIFAINGMGTLFLSALNAGDVPVLLGWFLIVAVFVIGANLFADVVYGLLDPRIRL